MIGLGNAVRMAVLLFLSGVSFFGAAAGGGKAAWFVFGCMAGLLATGLVAGFALRGRIEVARTLPAHALAAGSTVQVEGWVRVPFRFPLVFVLVSDTWLNERTGRTVRGACLLVPMGRTRLRYAYALPALERGVYRLKQTDASVADFFDLAGFRQKRDFRAAAAEPSSVAALPSRNAPTREGAADVFVIGPREARLCGEPANDVHREDPVSAGGTRPYAEGDPLGRIHWRSTLRRGKLMVMTPDDGDPPVPHLLLDAGTDEESFERALGAAAAFLDSQDAENGTGGRARADVRLVDRDGEWLSLASHGREALLRRLALVRRDSLQADARPFRRRGEACFLLAAGRMDDALAEHAARLAETGPVLVLAATGFAPPTQAEARKAERLVQAGIGVRFVRMRTPAFARAGRTGIRMMDRTAEM